MLEGKKRSAEEVVADSLMRIIVAGAQANGMRLIGDRVIGWKFVGGVGVDGLCANQLMVEVFNADIAVQEYLNEWCFEHRDGPYNEKEWDE